MYTTKQVGGQFKFEGVIHLAGIKTIERVIDPPSSPTTPTAPSTPRDTSQLASPPSSPRTPRKTTLLPPSPRSFGDLKEKYEKTEKEIKEETKSWRHQIKIVTVHDEIWISGPSVQKIKEWEELIRAQVDHFALLLKTNDPTEIELSLNSAQTELQSKKSEQRYLQMKLRANVNKMFHAEHHNLHLRHQLELVEKKELAATPGQMKIWKNVLRKGEEDQLKLQGETEKMTARLTIVNEKIAESVHYMQDMANYVAGSFF